MARQRISETCDLAKAIIAGDHDSDLEFIIQAAQHRKKVMFRKGTLVRIVEKGELFGKTGVVLKVNPTRISIGIGSVVMEGEGTPWAYEMYSEGEWNIPPRMLELA